VVEGLQEHYSQVWGSRVTRRAWEFGPVHELPEDFSILEFQPCEKTGWWVYATSGMAEAIDKPALELHLLSPVQSSSLVELLTVVAHYHCTGASLGRGHTVDFGRPWLPDSVCSVGLVSLPYLNGPALENFMAPNGLSVQCLWLIPVTRNEVALKKRDGLEALERLFERSALPYADPLRPDLAVRQ
jgi:hypothetical protein